MKEAYPYAPKGFLARAFPTPKYLVYPAVGIDISETSFKHISFSVRTREVSLHTYGVRSVPEGVIAEGTIAQPDVLVRALSELRKESGYTRAHVSLPEEHAYLFQTEVPKSAQNDLEQTVEFHLKENVPLALEDTVFDYSVMYRTEETLGLVVSAYPLSVVELYLSVFEEAGIEPLSFEPEGQASMRAVVPAQEKGTTLVVDLGKHEANVSIVAHGVVFLTAKLETRGDVFTDALTKTLSVAPDEAEKWKHVCGVSKSAECAPAHEALTRVARTLAQEISEHTSYWHMRSQKKGSEHEDISRVFLVGGTANMPGLPEFLSQALDLPVELGDVWCNIFPVHTRLPDISLHESLGYATAIGLALRSMRE